MFGGSFFGKTYFGGTYFGLNVTVTIVVRPSISIPSGGRQGEYTKRSMTLSKKEFEKDRQKHIDQLLREDEELINIIIELVKSGTI